MNPNQRDWFAQVLGNELGPMTYNCVLKMIRDGELAPDDRVRREGHSDWMTVDSLGAKPKTRDRVSLDPQVSTIAPLSIPRSRNESRVERIRDRLNAQSGLTENPVPEHLSLDVNFDPDLADVDESGYETPHWGQSGRSVPEQSSPASDESGNQEPLSLADPDLPEETTDLQDAPSRPAYVDPRDTMLAEIIADDKPQARKSVSADSMLQGVGKAIRARKSQLKSSNQPSLSEALSDLTPTWLLSPITGMVLLGAFVVYGLFWLFTPNYSNTAVERLIAIRAGVSDATNSQEDWESFTSPLKPEIVELVGRMTDEATAEDPTSQVVLWACTEMKNVLNSTPGSIQGPLEKFDSLMVEYRQATNPEEPSSTGGVVELPPGLR